MAKVKRARKAKGSSVSKRQVYWPSKGQTIGKSKYRPVGEEFFDNWR